MVEPRTCAASCATNCTPCGERRSTAIERLPRARVSTGAAPRRSTRTTLAPKSASIMPQKGAGAKPATSSTRIPANAIRWFGLVWSGLVGRCHESTEEVQRASEQQAMMMGDIDHQSGHQSSQIVCSSTSEVSIDR